MVEINWTREAQVWLKDIHSYIAIDNLMQLSARLPESLRGLNSSKPIPDLVTAMKQKRFAKYVFFYMAIIGLRI